MATEKSTATPELESVSKAEDMSKESVVEPQEESATTETQPVADMPVAAAEPETEDNGGEERGDENTVEEDADLADSISDKTKGELLEMLAQIIAERPVQDIRREVEAIKIAFYKRHRAEVDALRKAFAAEHGEDAEFSMEPDVYESRLKDLLRTYRTKRDEFAAVAEKAKEENYKIKLEIIEELKNLVKNEETLNNTFAKFRELQARWKETGPVPQQYVKDLWETYNLHVENFYDFVKINKELRDLDWKKNLELKTALCEQAERLAEEPSVVEAFRKLQKLHDDWREIGPVASEYKDDLWERFKEASSKINRSHQEFFERLKAEQSNNLERKTALCEQVEALAADSLSSHKAWNRASEKLLEIQKEWKTIGFAPKKDNTKVYERFRAACDAFFARKREFYSEVKDDMEKNLRLKEEICEAAEKLQESEEWKAATDELLALQARWKEIGAVSRRHSDAIWKRFRAACDKFFERKSAYFASVENEYAENLRKKSELIEQMLVADIKEGGHDMIKEFQRRWSEIGYVPIKHKDELQKRYKEAVDKLFGALRGSDREQSMSRFKEKVSSLRSAGDKRLRTERDKLYNRVRQLEQEIALLENNIGFFSKSKGAEALIADVQEKIARAKRDMADAIAKVKMIDGEQ
jgi:hypothetical protein